MSGRVGDLSAEQEQILKEFKEKVSDILKPEHDDYFVLRWLRARRFDIVRSEDMLRKHMNWRKQSGADTIRTDYKFAEVFEKYFSTGMIGFDKEGSPVRVVLLGTLDLEGATHIATKTLMTKNITKMFEEDIALMKQQSEKLGKVVETHLYIMDMAGFQIPYTVAKSAIALFAFTLGLYEANYPEYLKKAYIINAPTYFSSLFSLVKPFLSEETVKKLFVFGETGYQVCLLNDIDADIVPKCFGGNRVDPDGDPRCPQVIVQGGKVPTSYYLENQTSNFSTSEGVCTAEVGSGSSLVAQTEITNPGSVIQWEFETENGDIAVSLSYKTKDPKDKTEILIPSNRVDSHLALETGYHQCEKPGIYILRFDNSFSWVKKKVLKYRIQILQPGVAETDTLAE